MPRRFKSDLEYQQENGDINAAKPAMPTPTNTWNSQYSPTSQYAQGLSSGDELFRTTGLPNGIDVGYDVNITNVDKLYEKIGKPTNPSEDLINKPGSRYLLESQANNYIANIVTPSTIPDYNETYEKYDTGKPYGVDINEWRAQKQSVGEKFIRGSKKFLGNATTVFAETFTSIPGMVYGASQGNWTTSGNREGLGR